MKYQVVMVWANWDAEHRKVLSRDCETVEEARAICDRLYDLQTHPWAGYIVEPQPEAGAPS